MTWGRPLNVALSGLVTTIGFWLAFGAPPLSLTLLFGALATGFLWWKSVTIGAIWAWATLLLGLESLAWPVLTMVQVRLATDTPSDEHMATILSAVVAGLFSSVFWISFSYGLFRRARPEGDATTRPSPARQRGGSSRGKAK